MLLGRLLLVLVLFRTEIAGKIVERNSSCPKSQNGHCLLEEECLADNTHGNCGGDVMGNVLVCCKEPDKVVEYYSPRDLPQRTVCGRIKVTSKIYNGIPTEIGEFPWIAALLYVSTEKVQYAGIRCGGSLINERYVLTAAHCLKGQEPENIRVLLGEWNVTIDPDCDLCEKVVNATIEKIIRHPLYDSRYTRNDIGLLKLSNPVKFTEFVSPICLPHKDIPALTQNTELTVAGWGATEKERPADILLQASVRLIQNKLCLNLISKPDGISAQEFCAAHAEMDACNGDSGGPLIRKFKDKEHLNFFIEGIVGSGGSCKQGVAATVYTRILSFVNWIINTIASAEEPFAPCFTADLEEGRCVYFSQCPKLEMQYRGPQNSSEVDFVRRSFCGSQYELDLVCCGLPYIQHVNQGANVKDTPCITPTPESKDGKCVAITDCPAITDMLLKNNPDKGTIEYIQKTQCGFDGVPFVCCKASDQNTTTPHSLLNLFTFPVTISTTPAPIVENLKYFESKALPDRAICGSVKTVDQIAGGNDTAIGEFPWLAAVVYRIKKDERYLGVRCGGSLINQRYVLTAAHCVQHPIFEPFRVLLGDWKLSQDPDCAEENDCAPKVQNLTIERSIRHPFYSKLKQTNDIGLLRLSSDVEFDEFVRPICLPPPDLPPLKEETELTVAGWGLTENGTQSDIALKATVSLRANYECRQVFAKHILQETSLCAGGSKGDPCAGDGGGPLMRTYKDRQRMNWFLEGLVGSGVDCNYGASALIYTRVSKFTNWILRKIAETS